MAQSNIELPEEYGTFLESMKARARSARLQAVRTVNTELIRLYWALGRAILDRQEQQGWGAKVIDRLAADLRAEFPDMKGLSRSNLKYMRQMAGAWPSEVGQQAVGQLPWEHVTVLLDKLDDTPTRDWYAQAASQHGWSRSMLPHQIKA
jgi:predicted nuclease of restriction endonuclease-like (RecB) superfamily